MGPLLADALMSADLLGASRRAGMDLATVRRFRLLDPAFDLAMGQVDTVLGLAAVEAVRARAAAGDLKAIRALTDGSLGGLLPIPEEDPREELPEDLTSAEYRRALAEVVDRLDDDWQATSAAAGGAWIECPHCHRPATLRSRLRVEREAPHDPGSPWICVVRLDQPTALQPPYEMHADGQVVRATEPGIAATTPIETNAPPVICPDCGTGPLVGGQCPRCGRLVR